VVKNPQIKPRHVSLNTHKAGDLAQSTVEKIDFFIQLRDGMGVALGKVPKNKPHDDHD